MEKIQNFCLETSLREPYPTLTAKIRKESVKPVLEKYLQNNSLVRETLHKATRLQK